MQAVEIADGDHGGTIIPPLPHQARQVLHLEISQ
jgi:hypothetical protein